MTPAAARLCIPACLDDWPAPLPLARVVLALSIPGEPVPKGRPRLEMRGRHLAMVTPARTAAAETALAWPLKVARGSAPLLTAPLGVRLAFALHSRQRRDVDNLAKLVLDAANGIVWADDSQVAELHVRLDRDVAEPMTHVLVYLLKPP